MSNSKGSKRPRMFNIKRVGSEAFEIINPDGFVVGWAVNYGWAWRTAFALTDFFSKGLPMPPTGCEPEPEEYEGPDTSDEEYEAHLRSFGPGRDER